MIEKPTTILASLVVTVTVKFVVVTDPGFIEKKGPEPESGTHQSGINENPPDRTTASRPS